MRTRLQQSRRSRGRTENLLRSFFLGRGGEGGGGEGWGWPGSRGCSFREGPFVGAERARGGAQAGQTLGQGASGEEEMWLLCAADGVIQPRCASRDCSLKACSVNRDPSETFDWASFF